MSGNEDQEASVSVTSKRKRGRPSKLKMAATNCPSVSHTNPKRGRGRPKKVYNDQKNDNIPDPIECVTLSAYIVA